MVCIMFKRIHILKSLDQMWISYSSYSTCRHVFSSTEDAQLTPVLRLGAGACAGIIAMSATYPMDMVRGRITVQVLSIEMRFLPC